MTDPFCTHHFEYRRETTQDSQHEYMECVKCGLQNPLGLFQTVDFTRHKAAQEYLDANTSWDNWYDPPLRPDALAPHDHTDVIGQIRTCVVWKTNINKILASFENTFNFGHPWRWACRKCNRRGSHPTWELAYATANHHARNHHRSRK